VVAFVDDVAGCDGGARDSPFEGVRQAGRGQGMKVLGGVGATPLAGGVSFLTIAAHLEATACIMTVRLN
jgi:hypothetical protein